MTAHTDMRYEAAQIDASLFGDSAILIMVTEKGRVAVHMQKSALQGLYEQIRQALENEAPPSQTQ